MRGRAAAILIVMAACPAFADEPNITAKIARPASPQPPPTGLLSPNALPKFHCGGDYCGFDFLRDAWKQDFRKPLASPNINAGTIIIERSRLKTEAARWAELPPIFQMGIPGTNCTLGGYSADGNFGIGCGSSHHHTDPRFVCINRRDCTPGIQPSP